MIALTRAKINNATVTPLIQPGVNWMDERFYCQSVIEAFKARRDQGKRCDSYPRCPLGGGRACAFDDEHWTFKPGYDQFVTAYDPGSPIPYEIIPRFQEGDISLYSITGDSMQPSYQDGQVIAVRHTTRQTADSFERGKIADGQVCLVRFKQFGLPTTTITLKRLFRLPDGLVQIHADNPEYGDAIARPEDIHVFGIVIDVDPQEALTQGLLTPIWAFNDNRQVVDLYGAQA